VGAGSADWTSPRVSAVARLRSGLSGRLAPAALLGLLFQFTRLVEDFVVAQQGFLLAHFGFAGALVVEFDILRDAFGQLVGVGLFRLLQNRLGDLLNLLCRLLDLFLLLAPFGKRNCQDLGQKLHKQGQGNCADEELLPPAKPQAQNALRVSALQRVLGVFKKG
jgi:hypothetical protein